MAKKIESLYCFSSIPQPGATVYFYDFQKKKDDGLKYSLKDIDQILKDKKFNPIKSNSFEFTSLSDGAYPFYVSIDKDKKVQNIYFELKNNCGWGSSMFFERPERLIKEKEMIKKMPEGYQLDMTLAPAMAVKFGSRNRKTYYSFSHWEIDGEKFIKNNNNIKKKIGDLKINSNLIVLDDTGNLDRLDENIDTLKIYKKCIKEKNYYGVDDGLAFERITIPVKNKEYPIFIHHKYISEKEEVKELENDFPRGGLTAAIFPIISIQNIEGCYLSKDKDAKLIFKKEKDKGLSENLKTQIKKKEKNLSICQLDIDNLSSLNFITKLNHKIDRLSLVGFEHIDNWEPLLKLKNIKKLWISRSSFDLNDKKNSNIIKTLNKKKIITYIDALVVDLNAKPIDLPFEGGNYNGEFNDKKKSLEGYGVLSRDDGSVYSGYFKDSKFHGFGIYMLPSGSCYFGEWKNGNQDGSAIFASKDGFRYTGNFKNNKYHGKGEFYFESTGETAMIEHNEGVEIKKKS